MFDTFKYDWPDADGNLIETEFVGREGRSKMLHEDTRTTDIKWKQDPDFRMDCRIYAGARARCPQQETRSRIKE